MTLRHLNFVPVHRIPQGLTEGDVVGVAFAFDGLPSGYLVFVFDEDSAAEIVTEMQGEMGRAIRGLREIRAPRIREYHGQWDAGWVGESVRYRIESQPPKFVRDGESDIMDSIVASKSARTKTTHSCSTPKSLLRVQGRSIAVCTVCSRKAILNWRYRNSILTVLSP